MVRYNKTISSQKPTVRNYEGEKAFKGDKYLDLYLRTVSQLVMTDKFYGDKESQYQEWITMVREMATTDPVFLLQLAAYTRNEMKLRTAPIAMLTEVVIETHDNYNNQHTYDYVHKYAPKIIQRADELAEIIAYYVSVKGKIGTDTPKKNSLPRTLKTVINNLILSDKFSEYNLIKNDKNNAAVTLRDVIRITHPKPKDRQTSEFFRKIVKRESFADIADETWEGIISSKGSTQEAWSEAVAVMPIFATVRNLRNLFDNSVPFHLIEKHVLSKLGDEELVRKSRMLPFRFYQAYKEVKERNFETSAALEKAILFATKHNVPKLEGLTAIFVDVSGSMGNTLNSNSSMSYKEIGALFGTILYKSMGENRTLLCSYDDNIYPIKAYENDSIFHIMNQVMGGHNGGTDAWKCIQVLLNNNLRVDNIVFLSDEQSYNSSFTSSDTVEKKLSKYRNQINPNVILYDIDLSGYGTLQFSPGNYRNVFMGGWSERVFDLMNIMENVNKKGDIRQLVGSIYP